MKHSVFFLPLFFLLIIYGCSSSSSSTKENPTSNSPKGSTLVLISTSYGDMKVKLYDETPLHKANFLRLVNDGFYDSLVFHRIIKDFMIQGGNPQTRQCTYKGSIGEVDLIPAEFRPNLFHKKGALAAARTDNAENPERKSSGTQFYIVQGKIQTEPQLKVAERRGRNTIPEDQREVYKEIGGAPFLDQNYTVFGEVIEGLDVIDRIASIKTDEYDYPTENIIFTIKVIKK